MLLLDFPFQLSFFSFCPRVLLSRSPSAVVEMKVLAERFDVPHEPSPHPHGPRELEHFSDPPSLQSSVREVGGESAAASVKAAACEQG